MSSVTESTVVIASKHLIKTTLQPFMGLLEETSPSFPLAGLGFRVAVILHY